MNSTYAIKARYYTRQAWIHIGKAREAKLRLRQETDPFMCMLSRGVISDQARFARSSMRCATIYRQIDGRL